MRTPKLIVLVAFLPMLAAPVTGQFTSMKGDWWLDVTGDKGAMVLSFSEEQGSSFEVTGGGFSTRFRTFYTVSEETAQELFFDFAGRISGTIDLLDYTGVTPLGTLEITTGTVDEFYEFVRLKGFLSLAGGDPRKIVVKGERLPTTPPVWTGRTHRARVSGKDVKSNKYDVTMMDLPTVGFPSFLFTGEGSVKIDGEPRTDVMTTGVLLATPKGKLYGEITFDDNDAIVRGRVRRPNDGNPKVWVKGRTNVDDRRIRIAGVLDIPITLPPAQ
jgi:hypothetical protein